MQTSSFRHLLLGYYLATVLFAGLDLALGIDLRLNFLSADGWRSIYYAFCLACAALMYWRPNLSIYIGAAEGLVTICGLIFGMFLGYTLAGVTSMGELVQIIANYAISGYFAQLSWSRGIKAISAKHGID